MKKYLKVRLLSHLVLIAFSLTLLTVTLKAKAVQLGSMTIFSLPGENFQAEIEVTDLDGLNEAQVKVSIPDRKTFGQLGLKYNGYLDEINLLFLALNQDKGTIKVSSLFPIKDHKVVMLVNFKWPNGNITREYATALSKPDTAKPIAKIQLPTEQPKVDKAILKEIQTNTSPNSKPPSPSTQPSTTKQQLITDIDIDRPNVRIDIVPSDTLRNIAENIKMAFFRNKHDVSIEQIMLTILKHQSQAFQSAKDAKLKSGASISLPQYEDINKYSQQVAKTSIAKLNLKNETPNHQPNKTENQKNKPQPNKITADTKDTTKPNKAEPGIAKKAESTTQPKDRVKLSTNQSKNVNAKLAANLEELDKLKRQSGELKLRLQNLEGQLDDSKHLLSLKHAQLEEMKTSFEKAKQELAAMKERSVFDLYFNTPIFWISLAIAFFLLVIVIRILLSSSQIKKQQKKPTKDTMAMQGYTEGAGIGGSYSYEPSYQSPAYKKPAELNLHSTPEADETENQAEELFIESSKKTYGTEHQHAIKPHSDQLQEEILHTEMDARLDLAKAYIGMHAFTEAESLIKEVLHQGSEEQAKEANKILAQIQATKL